MNYRMSPHVISHVLSCIITFMMYYHIYYHVISHVLCIITCIMYYHMYYVLSHILSCIITYIMYYNVSSMYYVFTHVLTCIGMWYHMYYHVKTWCFSTSHTGRWASPIRKELHFVCKCLRLCQETFSWLAWENRLFFVLMAWGNSQNNFSDANDLTIVGPSPDNLNEFMTFL